MTDRGSRRPDHAQPNQQTAADDGGWDAGTSGVVAYDAMETAPDSETSPDSETAQDSGSSALAPAIRQVVFIDGSVPDAELLAKGVAPGVVAVILAPGADGVQQIANWLTSHNVSNLAAIDIVAHGSDGIVALGNTVLDSATLAQYKAELATVGAALQPGGEIQLYGCDVAQDASGDAFLQQLSAATGGASVAAASHEVGAATGGGSWNLDFNTGTVDVGAPFTAAAMSAYPGELALTTGQLFVVFDNGLSGTQTATRVLDLGVSGTTVATTGTLISNSSTHVLQGPVSIAVDAPRQTYYLVDYNYNLNTDILYKGSLSGGGLSVVIKQTSLNDYAMNYVALDQPNGILYYSVASFGAGSALPGIYSIDISNLSGTAAFAGTAVATFSSVSNNDPQTMALDTANHLIFFNDTDFSPQFNQLEVVNTVSHSIQDLTSQLGMTIQNELSVSNPNEAFITGVAVDTSTHTLFVTASQIDVVGYVYKMNYSVNGSGVVTLSGVTTLYTGNTGSVEAGSIALDTAHQLIYLTDNKDGTNGGVVYEGTYGGAALHQVFADSSGNNGIIGLGSTFLSQPTIVANGTISYVANAAAIKLDLTATASNPDGTNLAGATVAIAGGGSSFGDTLAATVTGTGITASFNSSTDTLTLSGNDTAAHYQQVLDSVTFASTGAVGTPRTVNWTVTNGVATSATATSQVTIHTPPTITAGATVGFSGGGSAVALDSGLAITDGSGTLASATVTIGGFIAGDSLTVGTAGGLATSFSNGTLTLTGTASVATYKAALDSVDYLFGPSNGDPTGGGTHTSRTITWSANNGFAASNAATSTLNITHAAPTVVAGATVSFTGGSSTPVTLDSGLTVADPDSGGQIASGTVTLGNFVSGDTLQFTNQNGITGSYNAATGVLGLSGTATVAQYQAALQSVAYVFSPAGNDATAGGTHANRTITWSVNDGVASGSATSTLNEIHTNPTVVAGASVTYPENASPLALDPTLTVSDIDSGGTLTGATVSITSGFLSGDTLHFTNQNGITGSYNAATGVLTLTGAATLAQYQNALRSVAYDFPGDPTNHLADSNRTISWTVTDGAGTSTAATSSLTVLCFCKGTSLLTPAGEVPVERLSVGDMVVTASGAVRPIRWIGVGRLMVARGRRTAATPVVVERGALGGGLPHRDLRITKAHALLVDEVLIPVEFLVNHRSIRWDDRAQEVSLYHIELETHDVLVADGAPAESYRDDGNRWLFQNANSGWDLPPQEPCAPVLTGGPVVDAAWRRLLDLAGPRHLPPLTEDPDLHLLVDGRRIDAMPGPARFRVFALPPGPRAVHIKSRETVPAELGLARDPRSLGVGVRRITLRHAGRATMIEAADPRLVNGFHGYEPAEDMRWTNGDAALPVALLEGVSEGAMLVVELAGATQYPLFDEAAGQQAA